MAAPSYVDVRLDPELALGAVSTPLFATRIIVTGSGAEQRIGMWAGSRRRYTATLEGKTLAQIQGLLAFWYAREGRLYGFRFKDWNDYSTAGVKYDLVELTATTFQLVKRYTSGAVTIVRTLYAPVAGTVQVWNAGTEITSGWTLAATTGVVTFSTDPGYVPSWTGEFDVPVRFDMADPVFTAHWPGVHSWDELSVIELVGST